MPTITPTMVMRTRKLRRSKSGTVTGYSSELAAVRAASSKGQSEAAITSGWSNGSWSNDTTSYSYHRIGIYYDTATGGNNGAAYQASDLTWSCAWYAQQYVYHYQEYFQFTIPSGLTSSDLDSATLTFTTTYSLDTSSAFYVCAPATSSSTLPIVYTINSDSSIYQTKKKAFTGTGVTGDTYTINIIDQLKQAIDCGQGWILITLQNESSLGGNYQATLQSATITYNVAINSSIRVVDNAGTGLDTYTVYVVDSNGTGLDTYQVYVVNSAGTGLDLYS